MLLPLDIPPGVYANGTDIDSAGRWMDSSLVRWVEGSMRPVGGWNSFVAGVTTAPPRAMHAWQDNSNDRWLAIGSASELFVIAASGVTSDITPVGLTAGDQVAQYEIGYGDGFYNTGFYGTERSDVGTFSEATTWSLDNFGENLIACSAADGTIYEWTLNTGTPAAAVANAPTGCLGAIVTEERFLVALGAGSNPRKVQWSDREDNTTWTPAATNQAGDQELQTSGQCMAAVRTRGATLILTDVDAHLMTYIGPPFVYGFERIGTSCGIISRKAVSVVDGGAYWMGRKGFFVQSGASVNEVPCDVYDRVFNDLNTAQQSQVWAVSNAQFGEIWWFYPSESSTSCDRYAAYNYRDGYWHIGALDRSCGVDRGVFKNPMLASTASDVFEHEVGNNLMGDVFAQSGPVSLGAGDQVMAVTSMIPDEQTQGDVTATFKARFHPNDVERVYGPYSMANPTSLRFTGRQIRMRVDAARSADWRVGVNRLEVVGGGRR